MENKLTKKYYLVDFLHTLYDFYKVRRVDKLSYMTRQTKEVLLDNIKKTIKTKKNNSKIIIKKKRINNLELNNNNKKMRI